MSMVGYAIIAFAVWKLTQIVTELGEIKEILSDIRRNSDHGSVQNLARAVSDASYSVEEPTHSEPQR